MSHHVPGPPDYDVVMTEQVPGLNGPKMLGRHKPTAPKQISSSTIAKCSLTPNPPPSRHTPGSVHLYSAGDTGTRTEHRVGEAEDDAK